MAQEGAIIKYRHKTQEDLCSIVNLKIVKTQEKRECTLVEGHDKRIELVLFEDEGLIKMKEFKPIEMGHISYKDTA